MPPFDTLRFSQRLRDAGFERGQAEALTLAIADAISENAAANASIEPPEDKADGLGAVPASPGRAAKRRKSKIDEVADRIVWRITIAIIGLFLAYGAATFLGLWLWY